MQKLTKSVWLGPVLSGVLAFVSICYISFILAWICYVPLFISIVNKSKPQIFKRAFIFGITFSCLAFYWMIPGAEKFTGYNMLYGFAVFLISSAFYSLFCGMLLYVFASIKQKENGFQSTLIDSLIVASVFCLAEAILSVLSTGLPWFNIHSGNGLAGNLYSIQPASWFGIHILTFATVVINYLVAIIVLQKAWKKLYVPIGIVVLYIISGILLFTNFDNNENKGKNFRVAILAENITPDIIWDNNTGNFLAQKLIDLNKEAAALKPDIALWSESAIPWTFRKDDDLVKEVFKITDPAKITHFMGINTAWKDNQVCNSAYCILPGEIVTGRYDKQHLLSFIEKRFNGWLMPFFSSKGYSAVNDTAHGKPLATIYGSVGFLICNEAAVAGAAATQVREGAQFLMNMSNDGWFNDTYIVQAHFYYARLRAVESRKDIAINCNNGYSGLVRASGEIMEQQKSNDPIVKVVNVQPNQYHSLASFYPNIFLYGCTVFLAVMVIINFAKRKQILTPDHAKS